MKQPTNTNHPSRPAELTRERILQAALEEFGSKGYAGARTAAIAARAGVNAQLITYHFGGKQGLLDELRKRWDDLQGTLPSLEAPFEEIIAAYFDATLNQPNWARLILWRALGDETGDEEARAEQQRTAVREGVQRIAQRQAAGTITRAFSPQFILVVTYALTFAPLALPHVVQGAFGVDPLSTEYREHCLAQLRVLIKPRPEEKEGDHVPPERRESG